jgi:hypothetical protein
MATVFYSKKNNCHRKGSGEISPLFECKLKERTKYF